MTADVLTVDDRGAVVVATLNRPQKANALNRDLIDALGAVANGIASAARGSTTRRALVLTGAGDKAFSAGADVGELEHLDWAAAQSQMMRGQRVFGLLEALPVVVIAAINGVAFGGGLELAMSADLRIAAPGARLGQPEITLGNLPGWGGTQRLPRLIGRGRALEMILTGDAVSATRAESMGLVNRVSDDCVPHAIGLAEQIGRMSPHAVARAKRAVNAGLRYGFAAGLQIEADSVADCCQTDEQRVAVAAFTNRRRGAE